ncbi:MAG: hypothetical protein AABX08_02135 [Nanoarchaeota archaeon]
MPEKHNGDQQYDKEKVAVHHAMDLDSYREYVSNWFDFLKRLHSKHSSLSNIFTNKNQVSYAELTKLEELLSSINSQRYLTYMHNALDRNKASIITLKKTLLTHIIFQLLAQATTAIYHYRTRDLHLDWSDETLPNYIMQGPLGPDGFWRDRIHDHGAAILFGLAFASVYDIYKRISQERKLDDEKATVIANGVAQITQDAISKTYGKTISASERGGIDRLEHGILNRLPDHRNSDLNQIVNVLFPHYGQWHNNVDFLKINEDSLEVLADSLAKEFNLNHKHTKNTLTGLQDRLRRSYSVSIIKEMVNKPKKTRKFLSLAKDASILDSPIPSDEVKTTPDLGLNRPRIKSSYIIGLGLASLVYGALYEHGDTWRIWETTIKHLCCRPGDGARDKFIPDMVNYLSTWKPFLHATIGASLQPLKIGLQRVYEKYIKIPAYNLWRKNQISSLSNIKDGPK